MMGLATGFLAAQVQRDRLAAAEVRNARRRALTSVREDRAVHAAVAQGDRDCAPQHASAVGCSPTIEWHGSTARTA